MSILQTAVVSKNHIISSRYLFRDFFLFQFLINYLALTYRYLELSRQHSFLGGGCPWALSKSRTQSLDLHTFVFGALPTHSSFVSMYLHFVFLGYLNKLPLLYYYEIFGIKRERSFSTFGVVAWCITKFIINFFPFKF